MKKKNRKLSGNPNKQRSKSTAAVPSSQTATAVIDAPEEVSEATAVEETLEASQSTEATTADTSDASTVTEDIPDENVSAEDISGEAVSEEVPPNEDTQAAPSRKKRVFGTIAASTLAVLGILLISVLGVFAYATCPYKSEVGKEMRHPADALPFCEVYGTEDIDVNKLGKYDIEISFFDLFAVKSHITVRDSVKPKISVRSIAIASDVPLSPEDIIVSAKDMTALTYEFVERSKIRATDEGGNSVAVRYNVTVVDELKFDAIEAGTPMSEVSAILEATGGLAFSQPPVINTNECGVYKVTCRYNGMDTLLALRVVDTTAPLITTRPADILVGQTVSPMDLVADISDVSDAYVSFLKKPIFNTAGTYDITLVGDDEYGNKAEFIATVTVYGIPTPLTLEAGSTAEQMQSVISQYTDGSEFPKVPEEFAPETLTLGKATTELVGKYSTIPLELNVTDTTAPSLTVRNISVLTGKLPKISNVVTDCTDASPFRLTFGELPDTTVEGSYEIKVIATDSSGNSTEKVATLRVSKDAIPPVIHGVKSITAYEGATISYRSGVYAIDENDGAVTVNVDTSRVNPNVAGVYTVTYSATDADGNTAKKSTTVTVRAITDDVINGMADEVLAKITTSDMSPREKARAIYDWCRVNIRYSTSTSHLMGYFNKAAYSGFTRHYGNCYTYYAVASALLTRAGIENIEIHRNSTTNPHYWNLVKMDGAWYHLDTCPQPAGHKLEVFLLKDSQIRAFTLGYYYNFDLTKFPATPK